MVGKEALGGLADLQLLGCLTLAFLDGGFILPRGHVWHTQVGTEHIDDGLAPSRVVLGEAYERVQRAQADRSLIVAELLDGLGVGIGDVSAILYGPPVCLIELVL